MIKALNLNSLFIKTSNKDRVEYYDVECAFDIETTSMTLSDGTGVGLMYAWAFGMKNTKHMVMGRTWEQFVQLMDELSTHYSLGKSRKLVVYVHNLGYEFQFMRKYFKWDNVFSVDDRNPILAETDNGIVFRDSLILSGYSLEKTAELLTKHDTKKLVGNLDYSLIRHQATELTLEEVQYLVNDVQVVLDYINEQRELYGNITKIPMTNTQRVRDYVRDHCYLNNNRTYKERPEKRRERFTKLMKKLTLTPEVYLMSKEAFQGGYVHANPKVLNKELADVISYDITSSYPSVMVTEQYPMSAGKKVTLTKDMGYEDYLVEHVLIFKAKFTKLKRKKNVHEDYLSKDKCTMVEPVINNGRVQEASKLYTTITNVDLEIINLVYDYEDIRINDVYAFEKNYLPPAIVESVVTFFKDKSTLKGDISQALEAQIAKESLNSTYGMMVTDVVRSKMEYNVETASWEENTGDIEEDIDNYNKKFRRFEYYPWGVFISAYARRNLWYAIISVGEDYVYSDTDSIKFTNPEKHQKFFEKYNRIFDLKLQRLINVSRANTKGRRATFKMEDFKPVDPTTGEIESLGHFRVDGYYRRFKTIGAKMYLAESYYGDSELDEVYDGELELTVAGLNKNQGREYLIDHSRNNIQAFELFNNTMTIPKEYSGKMTHGYEDDEQTFEVTDYQGKTLTVTSLSSVFMKPSEFTVDKIEMAEGGIPVLMGTEIPVGNHLL